MAGGLLATEAAADVARPEASLGDFEALGQEARAYHERIVLRSGMVAHDYWLLGRVLDRAREGFRRGKRPKGEKTRGTWYRWLKQHTIDRHRADRARLLAAAFRSAEELDGLTLEEALAVALARRHRAADAGQLARKLCRRLDGVARSIGRTADESQTLEDEQASLLAKADLVGRALDDFRQRLSDKH